MQKIKYILFTFLILFMNNLLVNAKCTNEELTIEQEKANEIKITYKHLGEVIKDDGSKVYNEFLVTTKNLEESQYIHLQPLANTTFINDNDNIKIILTTGKWNFNIYSSKCENIIKTINVTLPNFNIYSLDPLCTNVDEEEFPLCAKYINYEVSRETFERKINEYKKNNPDISKKETPKEKNNIKTIINKILNLVQENNLLIALILLVILIILIIFIIKNKNKKRKILE